MTTPLDSTDVPPTAAPTLAEELVEAVPDFFEKTGPAANAWNEMRQYRRSHYRRTTRATIFAPRDSAQARLTGDVTVTRDVSRCGIGILLRDQLFPGQHVELELIDGQPQRAEVIWCHREGKHFHAGCCFLPTHGDDASDV
jgi:hypothetical protein